ncbi:MAG: hypothetical protein WAM99_17970, partial [Xanthobacteraceae bacterium]
VSPKKLANIGEVTLHMPAPKRTIGMAKISKVVIGVPLPTAPPGFQWRSLGRWIDFHNAGSAPEMGRKASSDQPSPRRRPKRKSLRRRRIEGPAS